jgi:phosphoribosylformimino-5-aminoimidazole carboxamide ribotide isomerase
MIAIPAVDLRAGACVQLVGGSYDAERVRIPDPVRVARQWAAAGFRRLHVVDLDAATGAGSNDTVIDTILAGVDVAVQAGGGVRSTERLDRLLDRGAARVIVGTRALEDREWLADQTGRHPGRLIIAADVRGRSISVAGWSRSLPIDVIDLLRDLKDLPLAAVLVTAIDVEGRMAGPDLGLAADVVNAASVSVIASGGITTIDDLRALQQLGVTSAVVGMALYTGALDARAVAEEFAE